MNFIIRMSCKVNITGGDLCLDLEKSKEYDVRLTEKQMRELTRNMSKKERKEFDRRQIQAEADRDWDTLMMLELFMDD